MVCSGVRISAGGSFLGTLNLRDFPGVDSRLAVDVLLCLINQLSSSSSSAVSLGRWEAKDVDVGDAALNLCAILTLRIDCGVVLRWSIDATFEWRKNDVWHRSICGVVKMDNIELCFGVGFGEGLLGACTASSLSSSSPARRRFALGRNGVNSFEVNCRGSPINFNANDDWNIGLGLDFDAMTAVTGWCVNWVDIPGHLDASVTSSWPNFGTRCEKRFMMAWRVLPPPPPTRSSRWFNAMASLYLDL